MMCWCDCVDDDQLSTAIRARQRKDVERFTSIVDAAFIDVLMTGRFCSKPQSDFGDVSGTVSICEETTVADAVLAFGEHVDKELADEL